MALVHKMALKKRRKPQTLSHGRQPTFSQQAKRNAASSKVTRTIIRTHHQLQKAHAQAVAKGDTAAATDFMNKIEKNGGLKKYQEASITGQSAERGGDSSRLLMTWLVETGVVGQQSDTNRPDLLKERNKLPSNLKVLEVGALSPFNACSRAESLDVTRIDLHSQHPAIKTQDFMERPLPTSDHERFDIISLSLVLNYVPDAAGRGEMLKRTCLFLRRSILSTASHIQQSVNALEKSQKIDASLTDKASLGILPALFLVLPAPCVLNSRYLTEELLGEIMESLDYRLIKRKLTAKLIYHLWQYKETSSHRRLTFHKKEINSGAARNNFAVVLS